MNSALGVDPNPNATISTIIWTHLEFYSNAPHAHNVCTISRPSHTWSSGALLSLRSQTPQAPWPTTRAFTPRALASGKTLIGERGVCLFRPNTLVSWQLSSGGSLRRKFGFCGSALGYLGEIQPPPPPPHNGPSGNC